MFLKITCNTLGLKDCLKGRITPSNSFNSTLEFTTPTSLAPVHKANTDSTLTVLVEGLAVRVDQSDAEYLEPVTNATSFERSVTVNILVLIVSVSLESCVLALPQIRLCD